jgi:F0F1-type ATP synthase beta subunit
VVSSWLLRLGSDELLSYLTQALLAGEYDHLPEMAFYMIGDLEEAVRKADQLAMNA